MLQLCNSYLAHLALTVSGEEGHVVDLVHHHKVLLFPLKVLQHRTTEPRKEEILQAKLAFSLFIYMHIRMYYRCGNLV